MYHDYVGLHVNINFTKKIMLIAAVYFFSSYPLDASQKATKSPSCPELQCWQKAPCLLHKRNAEVVWNDAQRCLFKQALCLIGEYARSEHMHTHTVERVMPNTFSISSTKFDTFRHGLAWHFTADNSDTTHIKDLVDKKSTVARILLTDAEKKFFRRTDNPKSADYVTYYTSPFDGRLAISVAGKKNGHSVIHLIPVDGVLEQAGFVEKRN